jgi:hypothetical protein
VNVAEESARAGATVRFINHETNDRPAARLFTPQTRIPSAGEPSSSRPGRSYGEEGRRDQGATGMKPSDQTPGVIFYEDKRAVWRVTWTLALGFLLVSGLMRGDGGWLWPVFVGLALLLLWIGVSAVLRRAKPLLDVLPEGLRLHAGEVGLGGRAHASEYILPWEALTGIAFERRQAHRSRGGQKMWVTVLSFGLGEAIVRPDGHRGFLEKLSERQGEWALGEHWIWNPETRRIDLLTQPRGGFAELTAAVAQFAPWLGDASQERREGLGGSVAYALYDLAVAVTVLGTCVLFATDQMDFYARLAERLLDWGGHVRLW